MALGTGSLTAQPLLMGDVWEIGEDPASVAVNAEGGPGFVKTKGRLNGVGARAGILVRRVQRQPGYRQDEDRN